MQEAELVQEILLRNQSAMRELLVQYGSTIKSVVYQYLGTLRQYREECINDVLLKIWQNIGQFNSEKSTLKNWIAGICRYQAIDYRRKYLREMQELYLEDCKEQRGSDSAEEAIFAFSDETERILSALTPKDRSLLISLYADGEALDRLAAEMEMSHSGVYKRAERAKRKLRELFPEKLSSDVSHKQSST